MKKDTKKEITTGKHFFLMYFVWQYQHFLPCKLCTLLYITIAHKCFGILARSTFPVQFRFRFRSQVYLFTLHSFQDLFGRPPFPLSRRSFSIREIFM